MTDEKKKPGEDEKKDEARQTDGELQEGDLEGVAGGSNIMKNKHDTAKNSINNIR